MATGKVYERRWPDILQTFTIDGGSDGTVTVADTVGFFVKQQVTLSSATQPRTDLEVKRVTSPTTLLVGPRGSNIDSRIDVSAFLATDGAQIYGSEQQRPGIDYVFVLRHVYQEEPVVALRVLAVDQYGDPVGGSGGVASDVNLIKVGGAAISLGQKDMAHSVPVVLASDQSDLDVVVTNWPTNYDVSDRATRLLGVVYGSQGQQLRQTAVDFNLAAELFVAGTAIDPRQIRSLTSTDTVSAEITKWFGSTVPTVGQKQMDESIPVVLASDQSTLDVDVGNWPIDYDVSDRAARLVGRVYGSQGQQLKQTAVDFNLAAELFVAGTAIDPRQIRSLTAATDVVTATQGDNNVLAKAWPVKVTDGTNVMPTMDVMARAGFQKITDGLNTMPTMDDKARAGFQKITDGTNTAHVAPTAEQLAIYGGKLIYNIDKTSMPSMVYIGFAVPGSLEANAVWKIMRIDKTASPVRIRMCDADELFDNVWNNRTILSYS